MGRAPCCSKVGLHRGPWTSREDALLTSYIHANGEGNWRSLPKKAGLLRCGKSCRLRWMNYLRPDIKRGNIGPEEEDLIIRLHRLLGNRWSLIAGRLPGRTDNEIKNYWNSHLSKKLRRQGFIVKEATPRSKQPNSSQNSKKQISNMNSTGSNDDTTKIYAPKPTRLTARVVTENNCEEEKGPSVNDENRTGMVNQQEELSANDWSDVGELELAETHHGFFDSKYQSLDHLPFGDQNFPFQQDAEMFEKLYDEYSQLLQSEVDMDLFAHHDYEFLMV